MALIPLRDFAKENPYNFSLSTLKTLLKTEPSIQKAIKRVSARCMFVDEDALADWIASRNYYTVKLERKKTKS